MSESKRDILIVDEDLNFYSTLDWLRQNYQTSFIEPDPDAVILALNTDVDVLLLNVDCNSRSSIGFVKKLRSEVEEFTAKVIFTSTNNCAHTELCVNQMFDCYFIPKSEIDSRLAELISGFFKAQSNTEWDEF